MCKHIVVQSHFIYELYALQRNLETHSRSLAIMPFNRPYMISYLYSIVSMSLSCTISEILSLISQNLDITWPWPHQLKEQFVIPMLNCHMANQCTKFEVTSFSSSETKTCSHLANRQRMHVVSICLHYGNIIWLPWQCSLTNWKIRYRSIICT